MADPARFRCSMQSWLDCKRILMLGAYRLEEVPDHIVQSDEAKTIRAKRTSVNSGATESKRGGGVSSIYL